MGKIFTTNLGLTPKTSGRLASLDIMEIPKKTRSGRKVTLPQRFRVNYISWPSGPASSGGESCKGDHETRKRRESHVSKCEATAW